VADFVTRNNSELLAALGNFVNRTLTFAARYFEGRVPPAGQRDEADAAQLAAIAEQHRRTTEQLEALRFRPALGEVMALARLANGYFDQKQPWKQRKDDMAGCGRTINVCIQTVRALATMMAPFLPFSAVKTAAMLNLPLTAGDVLPWDEALTELPADHALGEPRILFTKIEPDALLAEQGG
jgi:methionyl-tRNA synthetase